ncbi:MAG: hypothetical protein IIZ78_00435 [Clostridiales bacterium]|nr:hypothetical protein [Clostridiales bacterium]
MANFTDLHLIIEDMLEQSMGKEAIDQLDLSNIASLGDYIINSGENGTNDVIFGKLVDRIGRTVIANRLYQNKFGFLSMDPFTYGYVLQKIHVDTFTPRTSGKYYTGSDPDTEQFGNYIPTINVSLFADSKAWEFAMTVTEAQIKSAFTDESTLAAFISGLFTAMDTSVAKSLEECARGVLAAYIGELYVGQGKADTAGDTIITAVNLLAKYQAETNITLTPGAAWYNADFLRWCTSFFADEKRMFTNLTVLRNTRGMEKFTPTEGLRFIINGKFADNIKRFMTSDVYNDELVSMPGYTEIDYWQGMGSGTIADRCSIDAKLISTTTTEGVTTHDEIDISNVIGVMYDNFAVGVTLYERDTVAIPVPRRHRTNYFEQCMVGNFIDLGEQGTMYYLAEVNP